MIPPHPDQELQKANGDENPSHSLAHADEGLEQAKSGRRQEPRTAQGWPGTDTGACVRGHIGSPGNADEPRERPLYVHQG